MTNYKLYQYATGEDECLTRESESLTELIGFALEESHLNPEYTYRLETWIDYERKYGFRYFEKGKEITEKIRNLILGSIVSNT